MSDYVAAYDEKALTLYVSIHQIFRIPYIPFYRAPVKLVTVLQLTERSSTSKKSKYLIASQNDLYQLNELSKFFSLFRVLSSFLLICQVVATAFCVIGQGALRPIVWWEEGMIGRHGERHATEDGSVENNRLTVNELTNDGKASVE